MEQRRGVRRTSQRPILRQHDLMLRRFAPKIAAIRPMHPPVTAEELIILLFHRITALCFAQSRQPLL